MQATAPLAAFGKYPKVPALATCGATGYLCRPPLHFSCRHMPTGFRRTRALDLPTRLFHWLLAGWVIALIAGCATGVARLVSLGA